MHPSPASSSSAIVGSLRDPLALVHHQRRVARERVAKGESARTIAKAWGVAHTTVARAVA